MIGRGRSKYEIYVFWLYEASDNNLLLFHRVIKEQLYGYSGIFIPSQVVQFLHIVLKMIFARYFYLSLGMANSLST